jgi:protease IV
MTNDDIMQSWDKKTLEKLLFCNLKEQRSRRRWGVFFKLLFAIYFFALLWLVWPTDNIPTAGKEKPHVALVEVRGEIGADTSASADNIIEGLQDAFKDKNTQGVILEINSPGGSPVQADDVYKEIRYLRAKYPKVKLYAVCSDLCASGAYYVAAAADDIYANPSSLVGSIGVLMDGFGFVDTMQKLGVQRRLLTAGAHKGFLDPFSPVKPEEQKYAQDLLESVHQQFIQSVEQGRGDRLKKNPDIFSGLVWSGAQALPLGLIDGFGDTYSVARDVFQNHTIVDYTVKPNFFEKIANRMGASFSQAVVSQVIQEKLD